MNQTKTKVQNATTCIEKLKGHSRKNIMYELPYVEKAMVCF